MLKGRVGVVAFFMLLDAALSILAAVGSFWLRFQEWTPSPWFLEYLRLLPLLLPLTIAVYYSFGLYNRIWRYASIKELMVILQAVSVGAVADTAIIYLYSNGGYPRSFFVILWLLSLLFIGGVRFAVRARRELVNLAAGRDGSGDSRRLLIVGAGEAGSLLAKELLNHPERGYLPLGFLDDDPHKKGCYLVGLPVLGTLDKTREVAGRTGAEEIIIAMAKAPGTLVRQVVEDCKSLNVKFKTISASDPGNFQRLREVQLEDLLGRAEIKVDLDEVASFLAGQTVLVTGAGGSIGSELCRQILTFRPAGLLLLGHGENSIYEIHRELLRNFPESSLVPIIADVRDSERIDEVFAKYGPEVVFHAAAHKHVPLMELNPVEAVQNNVFGTRNVAEAAHRHGSQRFVLVSTDKAVNPVGVMGATKRAAEVVIQELTGRSKTRFMAVRFGNVLGSRGSVVPLFREQIMRGGPVTVTHPDMLRYFMTIPEAVQLIVQAGAMGQGGEVFVLDMGEPVRIVDLAETLIRLAGLRPGADIPVVFSGMRPGEKLVEEILTAEEGTLATKHQRIYVARNLEAGKEAVEIMLGGFLEIGAGVGAVEERIVFLARTAAGQ